ncbi:retrovirus-related pol polyprotein from transposon TNT 1-94 [Tanacetum coccineum]
MIAPRVRDVCVQDMTSLAQESCFFARASESLNWLWHKRLSHLNFKIINQLAKHNLVIGLPSLAYSKDKPCSSCEKEKRHRASFKTKQTSSNEKCIHLLHMDLFRPVTLRSFNHEKYTLVTIDEYSRIDNDTEFRNNILVNFCDERGISQNFSSPYAPEQNGVAERRNRNLIEVARTMLSGSVLLKQYWTEAVTTACYTQNRSTVVKRHLKTPYEIFCRRLPNISFLHVFGCPVYIHNYKDHLGKFDEKADDGYFLANNINIVESERYTPDEYLHHFEPSQSYPSDQHDQTFQNDAHVEHLNHTNDENIIENLTNTKTPIITPPLATPAPQDRWAGDKHIEIFLAFATYMNFIVYQIDVKSAILNGKLKEEVYAQQPLSFESSEFPNHVYKLDKAFMKLSRLQEHGSLMYLTASRPDIQFSTCLCARYQANPKKSHLIVVKRIFRKSTSGACQLRGGKLVCWSAKKQQSMAMSSVEAEYVAAARCCANILWMKSRLNDYDIVYEKVPIFCDNTSAIAISNNPVLHARTKHINIIYHFIRYRIIKGDVELHFIPTQYQLVDIFTKPLDETTFKRLITELANDPEEFKALETTPKTEELEAEGKKPRAKTGRKKIISMRKPSCDSLPPNQGTDKGTINYSFDHFNEGTNPSVIVDKTKSVGEGLETSHTETKTKTENEYGIEN